MKIEHTFTVLGFIGLVPAGPMGVWGRCRQGPWVPVAMCEGNSDIYQVFFLLYIYTSLPCTTHHISSPKCLSRAVEPALPPPFTID
ncbi:hypothetical protein F4782DRAFT_476612 [Xylaria castorea]|nr:hypothetical protein F4782DRAFT_476612 [Xylaria castorea]